MYDTAATFDRDSEFTHLLFPTLIYVSSSLVQITTPGTYWMLSAIKKELRMSEHGIIAGRVKAQGIDYYFKLNLPKQVATLQYMMYDKYGTPNGKKDYLWWDRVKLELIHENDNSVMSAPILL